MRCRSPGVPRPERGSARRNPQAAAVHRTGSIRLRHMGRVAKDPIAPRSPTNRGTTVRDRRPAWRAQGERPELDRRTPAGTLHLIVCWGSSGTRVCWHNAPFRKGPTGRIRAIWASSLTGRCHWALGVCPARGQPGPSPDTEPSSSGRVPSAPPDRAAEIGILRAPRQPRLVPGEPWFRAHPPSTPHLSHHDDSHLTP